MPVLLRDGKMPSKYQSKPQKIKLIHHPHLKPVQLHTKTPAQLLKNKPGKKKIENHPRPVPYSPIRYPWAWNAQSECRNISGLYPFQNISIKWFLWWNYLKKKKKNPFKLSLAVLNSDFFLSNKHEFQLMTSLSCVGENPCLMYCVSSDLPGFRQLQLLSSITCLCRERFDHIFF